MLESNQVKDIVNSELDHRINAAREMSRKLRLHVNGEGLQEFLARINGYENESQFEAREKHAISNKFLTEELLRPTDNVFQARGGSKNYKFKSKGKEEALVEKLVNVKSNLSLSEYVEQEWFNRFITDPNGLIFMEISNEEIKPTYKSIDCIRAYEQNGMYVDWVIFEPHINTIDKDKEETAIFWAVDGAYYYLYKLYKSELELIGLEENSFDQVPAILCSNIVDNVTGWKKSPIDSQIELLDKYLVSNSVLSIAEFFHNYLQQWTYIDECNVCHGTGLISDDQNRDVKCTSCAGTGQAQRKDVTDIIKLRIPDTDGIKIDPPAGYIYAPTDAWDAQISSVDRSWNIIYFSQWGTVVSKDADNATATGRFLDAQPVNNRLDKYSKSSEKVHTALINFIGKFYFPETFERATIQYGRRYLIETPDQIWEKYINAKKNNAPVSTLDLLLSQFIESEFKENEQMFQYELKKSKLEPFIHWSIETVMKLNVNQIDYFKKLYFSDWIHTKDIREVIQTDEKKLDADLTAYAETKIPTIEITPPVEE